MEMSSKKKTKDCCSKDSQSKTTSITGNGKMWKGYVALPSNTAIPAFFNLKCRVLILIFQLKAKFYQTISFTSAGYSSHFGLFLK
jgi:hypothetical protein